MCSANAARVPVTEGSIACTLAPMSSMVFRSAPEILMPTGVLIPVLNMSMRPLIGIVHALVTPGTFNVASISLTSSCDDMVVGRDMAQSRFQPLRRPGRIPA